MTIPVISPAEARKRLDEDSAVLIDIREPMEHARESIPQARHCPLSRLDPAMLATVAGANAPAIIFHCQSGKRTGDNADRLNACSQPEAYMLEGGLMNWKAAGFPTKVDLTKPIDLSRQAQIAAGSLILLSLLLSWLASPLFVGLTAFVGAGLIFAGASGWCGMAHLLATLPWNRTSA